jgi:hypothetical protein
MIARLRARHRRWIAWIGALTLAGFVSALAARPERPLEPPPRPPDPGSGAWKEIGPDNQLRAVLATAGRVRIERGQRLVSPDLLVYWAPRSGDGLPPDAVLLGSLGDPPGRDFGLPEGASEGVLVIFSGGRNEVVAVQPVDEIPELR